MPPPRNDLSTAGLEEEEEALGHVIAELGGEYPQAASSPTREPGTREKPPKRKGGRDGLPPAPPEKKRSLSPRKKKNSKLFPKEERPELCKDNDKLDALGTDRAAKIVYHHSVEEARKKQKEKKNSYEKCDDELKKVSIPAGDDDAKDQLNIEARKLLRPVVKDIKLMMEWYPTELKEVIRNLPLSTFGLQDGVSTKSIELCHNLASTLEIKMFSPSNLRSSASSQQQKAFADKDGKLVVEQSDLYEDINSTTDVVMAWSTLDCVWSKLFPQWPTDKVVIRVLLHLKQFVQCGVKAKDVMVQWSNRLLALSSASAARRVEPVDFDRAVKLAGDVCYAAGFKREPPARSSLPQSKPLQQQQQAQQQPQQQRQQQKQPRGGAGETSVHCVASKFFKNYSAVKLVTGDEASAEI